MTGLFVAMHPVLAFTDAMQPVGVQRKYRSGAYGSHVRDQKRAPTRNTVVISRASSPPLIQSKYGVFKRPCLSCVPSGCQFSCYRADWELCKASMTVCSSQNGSGQCIHAEISSALMRAISTRHRRGMSEPRRVCICVLSLLEAGPRICTGLEAQAGLGLDHAPPG